MKRFLSMFLAIIMLLSLMPAAAFAEAGEEILEEEQNEDLMFEESEEEPVSDEEFEPAEDPDPDEETAPTDESASTEETAPTDEFVPTEETEPTEEVPVEDETELLCITFEGAEYIDENGNAYYSVDASKLVEALEVNADEDEKRQPVILAVKAEAGEAALSYTWQAMDLDAMEAAGSDEYIYAAIDNGMNPSALTASLELDPAEVLYNLPDAYVCTVTADSGEESVQQHAYFTVAGMAQAALLSDIPEAATKYTFDSFDEAVAAYEEYEEYYKDEPHEDGKMAHNLYLFPYLSETSEMYQAFSIDICIPFDAVDTYWSICNFNTDKSSLNLPDGIGFAEDPECKNMCNDGTGYAGIQNNGGVKKAICSIWDTEPESEQPFGYGTRYSAKFINSDVGSGSRFFGEGTGARCRGSYAWQTENWYRFVVRAYDTVADIDGKLKTVVESWVQDTSTGKWTLISRYNTGLTDSCLTTELVGMHQFVENFSDNYAPIRAVKWKNIYVLEKDSSEWRAITQADNMSTDEIEDSDNKKGIFAFGADEEYFWAISCGLGPESSVEKRTMEKDEIGSISNIGSAPELSELSTYTYPVIYPKTEAQFVSALETASNAEGHISIIIKDVNINLSGTYSVSNRVDAIFIEAENEDASLNLLDGASLSMYSSEIQIVGRNGYTASLTIEEGAKYINCHSGGKIGLNQYLTDNESAGYANLVNYGKFDGSEVNIHIHGKNSVLYGEYSTLFTSICYDDVRSEEDFARFLNHAKDLEESGSLSKVKIFVTDSFSLSKDYTIPANVYVFLGSSNWPSNLPREVTVLPGVVIENYGRIEIYDPFRLVICQGARFGNFVSGTVNGSIENNGIYAPRVYDRYVSTEEELCALLDEYDAKNLRIHVMSDITLSTGKRIDIGRYGFIELVIEPGVTFEVPEGFNFVVDNHSSVIIKDGATLINSSYSFDLYSGTVLVEEGGTFQNNRRIWIGNGYGTSTANLVVYGNYTQSNEREIFIEGINCYAIGVPEEYIALQTFYVRSEEDFAVAAFRAEEGDIHTQILIHDADVTLTGEYTLPRNVSKLEIDSTATAKGTTALTLAPGAKLYFYGDCIDIDNYSFGAVTKLIISENAELFVSGVDGYGTYRYIPKEIPKRVRIHSDVDEYRVRKSYLINNGTFSTDYGIAVGHDEHSEISGTFPDNVVFGVLDENEYDIKMIPATQIDIYKDGKKVTGQTISISRGNTQPIKLSVKIAPTDAFQIAYWEVSNYAGNSNYAEVNQNGEVTFHFDKIPSYFNQTIEVYAYTREGSQKEASVKFEITKSVESIYLSGISTLASGASGEISANVQPSNASNRQVVWSSSDPSVATVSAIAGTDGRAKARVTAKTVTERKTVTITATAADGSGISASRVITVTPIVSKVDIISPETEAVITGQTLYLDMGEENPAIQLAAVAQPGGASQVVTWKSSAPTIAAVDENGRVTPVKVGTATITATAVGGKTASVTVKVSAMVHSIEIEGSEIVAAKNTTALKAVVLPENASNKGVTWTSSDPAVAAVSTTGVVTGKTAGTTTITATAKDGSGIFDTKQITVPPVATDIKIYSDITDEDITGSALTMDLAEYADEFAAAGAVTYKLNAAAVPEESYQSMTWKSSSTTIATVSTDGLVKFLKPGTVTITATTMDGSAKSAAVKLTLAGISVSANVPALGLQIDDTAQLSVFGADKSTALDPTLFNYTVKNGTKDGGDYLSVDENGVMTAHKSGVTVTVTAALRGDPIKRSAAISVKLIPIQLEKVSVNPLDAEVKYRDDAGTPILPGFYGVDANGNIAANDDETVSYALYVTKQKVAQPVRIAASAIDSDNNEVESVKGKFTWASTNTGIATVAENTAGEVTVTVKPNVEGECTITATSKDIVKAKGSIAVYVMDYAPKLGATSVTINTYKDDFVSVPLIERYGNSITGIEVYEYDAKTKKYDTVSERIFAVQPADDDYEDNTVKLKTNRAIANGNVATQLGITCKDGNEYRINLTVVSKATLPTITVTQAKTETFSLLYKDSMVNVTVTAASGKLAETVLGSTVDESYNPVFAGGGAENSAEIRFASGNETFTPKSKSIKLLVDVEGWKYPVEKTFTLVTNSTKPSYKLSATAGTIKAVLGERTISFSILDSKTNDLITLDEGAVKAIKEYNFADVAQNENEVSIQLKELIKAPYYAGGKIEVDLMQSNWTAPIRCAYTLSVLTADPTARFSTTTITVNRIFKDQANAAKVTVSTAGVPVVRIDKAVSGTTNPEVLNWVDFAVDQATGNVTAKVIGNSNDIVNGTYSLILTPVVLNTDGTDHELNKTTVKLVINSTLPTVKLSKGTFSLNSVFREKNDSTAVTLSQARGIDGMTATLTAVPSGVVNDDVLKAKFDVSFDTESKVLSARLNGSVPNGTYTFNVEFNIENEDNCPAPVKTALKITVVSTLPTVRLSKSTLTLNRLLIYKTDETAVNLNRTDLTIADSSMELTGAPSGVNRIEAAEKFRINYSEGKLIGQLAAEVPNGTYTFAVTLTVSDEGGCVAPVKTTLKITVLS